jgi:hypothetical protein
MKCNEPERREGSEAAVGSAGVEPLEDGPEQAPQARPEDERDLPPVTRNRRTPINSTHSPIKLTTLASLLHRISS